MKDLIETALNVIEGGNVSLVGQTPEKLKKDLGSLNDKRLQAWAKKHLKGLHASIGTSDDEEEVEELKKLVGVVNAELKSRGLK